MAAILARTSASPTSLSLAVWMSVCLTAARSAPRSDPANSHDFLPSDRPRSARSAALSVRQMRMRIVLQRLQHGRRKAVEPLRMSGCPVANHSRTPAGTGIIAATVL